MSVCLIFLYPSGKGYSGFSLRRALNSRITSVYWKNIYSGQSNISVEIPFDEPNERRCETSSIIWRPGELLGFDLRKVKKQYCIMYS